MDRGDVVIIGAGVIGCSLARQLAGSGCRVVLIDRGAPGAEASNAAAGMLAPSAEAEQPSPLFRFALRSRALYPALSEELTSETGIDPQYRDEGTLLPFAIPDAGMAMRASMEWQREYGVHLKMYSFSQLDSVEPGLGACGSPGWAGALHLLADHQIDNRLLIQALARSCRMRGVIMELGQPALRVVTQSGKATGVEIGPARAPRTIHGDFVINASGAWAAQFCEDGIPPLPIRPVKGHMLALAAAPETLRHVIRTEVVYLVPRRDGRIIVGSTMEEAGFDKIVQAEQVAGLLDAAKRVCPSLARAEFREAWTGLRPATPDGLPVIGPMPGVAGLWNALGHFRNGILLAPATAQALTAWILDGHPPAELAGDLDAFSAARFLR